MGVLPEKVVKKCLWATGRLDPITQRTEGTHYEYRLPTKLAEGSERYHL